jgi:serine protease Do
MTPQDVYENYVNAVVAISNEGTTTNVFGQVSSTASSGSGMIISEDGYILTNNHVVEDAQTLTVTMTSGEEYDATIIGTDSDNDVALIKIDATDLPTVSIGNSDDIQVGQQVCAIGNPLGELTNTLTVGYVSALDREVNTDGTPINMLQTDCAINPGNSGGPLFDMYGNVIGITTAKYSTSSSTTLEGLGFALPINDVMTLVADIQQNGYVTGKPYLGIYLEDLNVTMASYYNLPVGVYVRSTVEGSCADKAGVQSGDIITALDDTTIQTYTELSAAMRDYKAGDTATLTVYRNNESIQLTVTFDEKVPDYVTEAEEEETAEEETSPYSSYGSYGNSPFSSFFGGIPSTGSSDSEDSGTAA